MAKIVISPMSLTRTAIFTFNKSIVRWIGSKGKNHGFADVYVDGVLQGTVDTCSDKERGGQVLFEKSGLSSDRI
ncbi:MAG: hypothetical protein ACYS0H_03900, partial [Planctomycetota bacterium]